MTDRELLETAAKALGWRWSIADLCWYDDNAGTWKKSWNPLTDDGDALRLAAELNIDIEMGLCFCETTWVDLIKSETHRHKEDWGAGDVPFDIRMKRICRAIVQAAAEIGKGMP